MIELPALPHPAPLPDATLFAFDDWAFPFYDYAEIHLTPGANPRLVLDHGSDNSADGVLLYYGTVIRVGDTFHMWYNANFGPLQNTIGYERVNCLICYATSKDGIQWVKPSLGLFGFRGSRDNNIVDFRDPTLWSTAAVLYEPTDPNPARRFKMVYEVATPAMGTRFSVAFSPDGLRWRHSPHNPVGPNLEMSGVTKFRGLYYVNGQASRGQHRTSARRLMTFASPDFERWSPCAALGLDRAGDRLGPSVEDGPHELEQIHLGAALWNRGNVLLGIYGQWHADPSGDRRRVVMDLGLCLSHDAIHYREPIPGFRFIPAREQPGSPKDVGPALMQGQGMENVGDRTLYWYSLWRGTAGSGVRMVSWPRDRFGMLKPSSANQPRAITCPLRVTEGVGYVYVNASGLGAHSRLRVELLDVGFQPISGFSAAAAPVLDTDGFRVPVRWQGGNSVTQTQGLVRIDVRFEGDRPEDCRLHAVYVSSS
jgi:hypothetical protein